MRIQAVGDKWYYEDGDYYWGAWQIRPSYTEDDVWFVSGKGVSYATPFHSLEEAEKFAEEQDKAWLSDGSGYRKDGWRVEQGVGSLKWRIVTPQYTVLPARFDRATEAMEEVDKITKAFHDLDLILNHKCDTMEEGGEAN